MKTNIRHQQKKSGLFIFLLSFSFILLAGCEKAEIAETSVVATSTEALRSGPLPPPPVTILIIEHNCMFSSLPDYNVYLQSDGRVIYHGWKNVAHTGMVIFQTNAATVSYIKNLFESGNFFSIQGIPEQFDDPFVSTNYSNGFATKTLIDYDQGKPQLLIQIRKEAEEKLGIAKYVKFDRVVDPVAEM